MEMGWRSRWAFGVCDSIPQKALLVQVDRLRLRLRGGPLPEVAKTIILFFLVCRRLYFCFLTLSTFSVQGRVEARLIKTREVEKRGSRPNDGVVF